eukprot:6730675-Pyramimonas_sp.AAC.1
MAFVGHSVFCGPLAELFCRESVPITRAPNFLAGLRGDAGCVCYAPYSVHVPCPSQDAAQTVYLPCCRTR